jgi:SAM-dependent methyltransferase
MRKLDSQFMDERNRLTRVYRRYDADPAEQAKRDPRNRGNAYELRAREDKLDDLLATEGLLPLEDRRLLEIGCGFGYQLQRMVRRGASPERCYGVDILADRIQLARRLHPEMHFSCADARQLAFDAGSFDIVLCFVVFSSILDKVVAAEVAVEIDRLLKPGGAVIWYDNLYANPSNRDVHAYTRADIKQLFRGYRLALQRTTLIPPLARRLGPMTPLLYPILSGLPFLRVRLLGVLRKPGGASGAGK